MDWQYFLCVLLLLPVSYAVHHAHHDRLSSTGPSAPSLPDMSSHNRNASITNAIKPTSTRGTVSTTASTQTPNPTEWQRYGNDYDHSDENDYLDNYYHYYGTEMVAAPEDATTAVPWWRVSKESKTMGPRKESSSPRAKATTGRLWWWKSKSTTSKWPWWWRPETTTTRRPWWWIPDSTTTRDSWSGEETVEITTEVPVSEWITTKETPWWWRPETTTTRRPWWRPKTTTTKQPWWIPETTTTKWPWWWRPENTTTMQPWWRPETTTPKRPWWWGPETTTTKWPWWWRPETTATRDSWSEETDEITTDPWFFHEKSTTRNWWDLWQTISTAKPYVNKESATTEGEKYYNRQLVIIVGCLAGGFGCSLLVVIVLTVVLARSYRRRHRGQPLLEDVEPTDEIDGVPPVPPSSVSPANCYFVSMNGDLPPEYSVLPQNTLVTDAADPLPLATALQHQQQQAMEQQQKQNEAVDENESTSETIPIYASYPEATA